MLLLFGFLFLLAFSIVVVLAIPALWGREIHHIYSATRPVTCPETNAEAGVTIDARHAATTALRGKQQFRLKDCTQWPARIRCNQECLAEALRREPYKQGEVQPSSTEKQIYHLPVLLAAAAAWYVGMVWHSPFLFRARWMTALGLSHEQLKQMLSWYSPHLLSIAACLLFAYGVACLQNWMLRKGLWWGIVSAALLWGSLALATSPSLLGLPGELLAIEAGYTLIATVLVGTIIGGLSGKLMLKTSSAPPQDSKTGAVRVEERRYRAA
jgi:uncharacterized protein (DUF58 family)